MSQTINQEFIDGLITVIMDAENAGSITSEMVAQVFDHLNKGYKILAPLPSALTALEQSVQTVSSTAAQNKLALDAILGNDTGSAIENLKEVIDFLEGVSDDEKLTAKLQEFRNELNTAKTEIAQLTKQGNGIIVFSEFVEAANVSTGKSEASSTSAAFDVVFDRKGKRFLLRRKMNISGGIGDGGTLRPDDTVSPDLQETITGPAQVPGLTQYWADWADRDKFTLNAGRVYICEAESALYTYNGTTLVPADRSAVAVAELVQTVTANKNACDAALAASNATTSALRTDVDAASSKANRASLDASNALTAASVATQSINAALEKANDAAKDAADAGRRIDALESATHFEELASEAEWQARKTAGTLSPDKLYYIAEA